MTNFRKIVILAAAVLIVVHLVMFNFQDFSWAANSGNYLSIVAMLLVIVSMVLAHINKRKQAES